jgi:arsenate reductase (glutaredoxin)
LSEEGDMSDEWTIYFNKRCGSCRGALAILEKRGVKPRIVEYLDTPPTPKELEGLLRKLGAAPEAITRFKESVWQEKGDESLSHEKWVQLIADNPILLQRPIVTRGDRAVVARPPEKVEELF